MREGGLMRGALRDHLPRRIPARGRTPQTTTHSRRMVHAPEYGRNCGDSAPCPICSGTRNPLYFHCRLNTYGYLIRLNMKPLFPDVRLFSMRFADGMRPDYRAHSSHQLSVPIGQSWRQWRVQYNMRYICGGLLSACLISLLLGLPWPSDFVNAETDARSLSFSARPRSPDAKPLETGGKSFRRPKRLLPNWQAARAAKARAGRPRPAGTAALAAPAGSEGIKGDRGASCGCQWRAVLAGRCRGARSRAATIPAPLMPAITA